MEKVPGKMVSEKWFPKNGPLEKKSAEKWSFGKGTRKNGPLEKNTRKNGPLENVSGKMVLLKKIRGEMVPGKVS